MKEKKNTSLSLETFIEMFIGMILGGLFGDFLTSNQMNATQRNQNQDSVQLDPEDFEEDYFLGSEDFDCI